MFIFHNYFVDFLVFIVTIYVVIRLYYNYCYSYWKNLGIPYLTPNFPLGNSFSFFPKYSSPGTVCVEFYRQVKEIGCKYAGIYLGTTPNLVVNDPDIIKNILTKDFDYFTDRGLYVDKVSDPLTSNLFTHNGIEWRPIRVKLTQVFTPAKLKTMFKLMFDVSQHMVDYLNNHQEFDAKEVMRYFTVDVIGVCAFGINCNSFNEQNAEFVKMTRRIFERAPLDRIKKFFVINFPNLSQKIGIKQIKKDVEKFFFDVTKETVESRQNNQNDRGDFIQLLIDIRNKLGEDDFTLENMAAQTFMFFFAGFDTSSTTLSFALYELAQNPDCQDKLRNEINEVLEKTNGEITFECLQEMKYLQMVIDETVRMYPAVPAINRRCVKDYIIPGTNHRIEKGINVLISLLGLHRDPNYWENPQKFDPERFSNENKHSSVHIPFGIGPRNCIGMRFGLMQTRLGLVRIIKDFKLSPCSRTKTPELDTLFLLTTKNPIYLKIEKILSGH